MERRYRLREDRDFQGVRQEGASWPHPLLVLFALPNGLSHNRFGFSVSRRIGKATVRNRLKRLVREAVRKRLPHIAPGYDLVFLARSAVAGADFRQVEAAVEGLLGQAGLLRKEG